MRITRERFDEVVGKLDDRRQKIIRMRFDIDAEAVVMRLKDIAKALDISTERVRQLENNALCQMRAVIGIKALRAKDVAFELARIEREGRREWK